METKYFTIKEITVEPNHDGTKEKVENEAFGLAVDFGCEVRYFFNGDLITVKPDGEVTEIISRTVKRDK